MPASNPGRKCLPYIQKGNVKNDSVHMEVPMSYPDLLRVEVEALVDL